MVLVLILLLVDIEELPTQVLGKYPWACQLALVLAQAVTWIVWSLTFNRIVKVLLLQLVLEV